jgi:predicted nuclease of predicted toxin-antitoxin system
VNFFLDHDVPDDVGRVLRRKGHSVQSLKDVLPQDADDLDGLRYATERRLVVITCNRRDFLRLVQSEPYTGLIILVRRRTRVAECAAILRLLDRAGDTGILHNINFA